jgi:hypothetical protein
MVGGPGMCLAILRSLLLRRSSPRRLMEEPCSAGESMAPGRIEAFMLELRQRLTVGSAAHRLRQIEGMADQTVSSHVDTNRPGPPAIWSSPAIPVRFSNISRLSCVPRRQRAPFGGEIRRLWATSHWRCYVRPPEAEGAVRSGAGQRPSVPSDLAKRRTDDSVWSTPKIMLRFLSWLLKTLWKMARQT